MPVVAAALGLAIGVAMVYAMLRLGTTGRVVATVVAVALAVAGYYGMGGEQRVAWSVGLIAYTTGAVGAGFLLRRGEAR